MPTTEQTAATLYPAFADKETFMKRLYELHQSGQAPTMDDIWRLGATDTDDWTADSTYSLPSNQPT